MIRLHNKEFKPYISADQLDKQIERIANEVYQDAKEKPLFVAILNGSFMFASDFMKKYKGECEITFVKLSSYQGMESTHNVKQLIGLNCSVEGREIVVLEDIIDTGNTLEIIHNLFQDKKAKSVKIATLFFKPEAYTKNFKIDYIGFSIPNRFIVGYGLDYDEIGRNLAQVYQLKVESTMKNIVLFGKPGAGKGTQASFLKEKFQFVHISTGDVFRYNIKNGTDLGKLAQSYMDKGDLVPDEITIKMLQAQVNAHPQAKGFIFDGFPRTIAQAKALDDFLLENNMEISGTIGLDADDEILIQRLLERGKVSGRVDDQDENKIRNRFAEYNNKTAPLIQYYEKQGKYHSVNGIGSIEEITQRLCQKIESL